MELTVEQLTKAIETIAGTRKYLPISENEGTIVFKRHNYFHLFIGLESRFGTPSAKNMAEKILEHKADYHHEYHPELLELINGL